MSRQLQPPIAINKTLLFGIERYAKPLTVRSCSPRNRLRLTVLRTWDYKH